MVTEEGVLLTRKLSLQTIRRKSDKTIRYRQKELAFLKHA